MSDSVRRFNPRAFATLMTAISFVGLPLTGTGLHFASKAANQQVVFLGLSRHAWMSVHNTLGLLFVISIACHLFYNWRPLLRYLGIKAAKRPRFIFELVTAVTIVAGLVGAVFSHTFLLD